MQLLKFLSVYDITILVSVNKSVYKLITSTQIYREIIQIIKKPKNKILKNCYEKGLLHILKNYSQNRLNILDRNYDIINCASENGHVTILEWFKNSGLEFKYSEMQ